MVDTRLESLQIWLAQLPNLNNFTLTIASSDASFRRYFRILSNGVSYIAMDADPAKEDSHAFISIAKLLLSEGINVPEIFYQNFDEGFFLISDLGDSQYLKVLNESSFSELYQSAIKTLIKIQLIAQNKLDKIPSYDQDLLMQEMSLFTEWYLQRHLGLTLNSSELSVIQDAFTLLQDSALAQHQVLVHRDYHSRNLMVNLDSPGVLDFQDAVIGPFTYDLVSILRDCYINWPEKNIYNMVIFYKQLAEDNNIIPIYSEQKFFRFFNLMGIQRHLKAIGIFSRLNYRDNKSSYLLDIPRTLNYILQVSIEYPELSEFNFLLMKYGQ